MAKGKFEYWLTSDGLVRLSAYARDGLSDEQIANNCGISPSTLYEWKKRFPEISEAFRRGKEVVDIEVENALLKKALGYTVALKKTFKVKRVEYENGKRVLEKEELVTGYDEMHVPADTVAQKFWLINRSVGNEETGRTVWKDKPIEDTGSMYSKLDEIIEGLNDAAKR